MISTAISQLPSLRDINGGQSSAPSSPLLATRKVEVGGEAHITIVRKGALKSTKAGGEYTLDGCAPGTRHGSPIASLERLSNLPSNSKLALSLNTQGGEGPLLKSKTKSAVRVDRPTSAKKSSSRLSTPAKQSKPTSARPTSAGKRPGSGGKVSATGPKRSKSPSSAGRTRIGSAKSWTKPGASPSAAGTGQKLKIKKPVEVPKRPLTLKEQQLLEACDRGDLDFLYECLWRNPDINCRKPVFGSSPLSVACRKGNGKVASLLLSFGADVAAQDEYGVTPLHWAANSGDSNLVTLILRKAASTGNLGSLVHVPSPTSLQNTGDSGLLSRKDLFGSTPLHFASVNNMPGAVKALIAAGCDATATNNDGRKPSEVTTDDAIRDILHEEEHRIFRIQNAALRAARKGDAPKKGSSRPGTGKKPGSAGRSAPSLSKSGSKKKSTGGLAPKSSSQTGADSISSPTRSSPAIVGKPAAVPMSSSRERIREPLEATVEEKHGAPFESSDAPPAREETLRTKQTAGPRGFVTDVTGGHKGLGVA